jgi:hypothetical protein
LEEQPAGHAEGDKKQPKETDALQINVTGLFTSESISVRLQIAFKEHLLITVKLFPFL